MEAWDGRLRMHSIGQRCEGYKVRAVSLLWFTDLPSYLVNTPYYRSPTADGSIKYNIKSARERWSHWTSSGPSIHFSGRMH